MAGPTPYPELNDVLGELVTGVRAILGATFCGAYLQGSFAVGDADEHSDVDFVVVTNGEPTDAQVAALQEMHARIYALDVGWAQHLEGSYVPKEELRRVDPARAPYLYLDNGATELVRDNHCNTAVVRWSLREHGVVLAGPEPEALVDPVSTDDLRREVREAAGEWAAWADVPAMSRWKQPLLVLSFCRILQTLATGEVRSKRAGGEWGLRELDAEWGALIRQALEDRPDPWGRVHRPAEPGVVERTRAFVRYALEEARAH
jgi:predicted nucleotidyltransferase